MFSPETGTTQGYMGSLVGKSLVTEASLVSLLQGYSRTSRTLTLQNGTVIEDSSAPSKRGIRVAQRQVTAAPAGWTIIHLTTQSLLLRQGNRFMAETSGEAAYTYELPAKNSSTKALITPQGDLWVGAFSEDRGYQLFLGSKGRFKQIATGEQLGPERAFKPYIEMHDGVLGVIADIDKDSPEHGDFEDRLVTQMGPSRQHIPAIATRRGIRSLGLPPLPKSISKAASARGIEIYPICFIGDATLWIANLQADTDPLDRWDEVFLHENGKWSSVTRARGIRALADTSAGTCVLLTMEPNGTLRSWKENVESSQSDNQETGARVHAPMR